ncbi:hypothetical protein [Kribbella albertanoniae]|uniref:Uncharacterized protein n=1 Tax=Kribbella albertanoniae TaxID=1266829 RepID=A0A4R4PVZ7_9ACTN|nr:hypothetical protein [Kribbella albertanoniae]TDC26622.1 hypothetical protein E1261_22110 [Kribbella albertanoniae]
MVVVAGVLVVSATGCTTDRVDSGTVGEGVLVAGGASGVTLGAGCCRPASGKGISGVSTRGPPTKLLTSRTTYPTTGTATIAPTRRILR